MTGEQRRKGQRRRGRTRPDRDLHDADPRHQCGWPMFVALMSSLSRGTKFTKFVSEEIATARASHFKAASDPDASQPAPSCAL